MRLRELLVEEGKFDEAGQRIHKHLREVCITNNFKILWYDDTLPLISETYEKTRQLQPSLSLFINNTEARKLGSKPKKNARSLRWKI